MGDPELRQCQEGRGPGPRGVKTLREQRKGKA